MDSENYVSPPETQSYMLLPIANIVIVINLLYQHYELQLNTVV